MFKLLYEKVFTVLSITVHTETQPSQCVDVFETISESTYTSVSYHVIVQGQLTQLCAML